MRNNRIKLFCMILLFQSTSLKTFSSDVDLNKSSYQEMSSKISLINKTLEKEIRKRINAIDFDRVRIESSMDYLNNELNELAVYLLKIRANEELFTHGNRWDTQPYPLQKIILDLYTKNFENKVSKMKKTQNKASSLSEQFINSHIISLKEKHLYLKNISSIATKLFDLKKSDPGVRDAFIKAGGTDSTSIILKSEKELLDYARSTGISESSVSTLKLLKDGSLMEQIYKLDASQISYTSYQKFIAMSKAAVKSISLTMGDIGKDLQTKISKDVILETLKEGVIDQATFNSAQNSQIETAKIFYEEISFNNSANLTEKKKLEFIESTIVEAMDKLNNDLITNQLDFKHLMKYSDKTWYRLPPSIQKMTLEPLSAAFKVLYPNKLSEENSQVRQVFDMLEERMNRVKVLSGKFHSAWQSSVIPQGEKYEKFINEKLETHPNTDYVALCKEADEQPGFRAENRNWALMVADDGKEIESLEQLERYWEVYETPKKYRSFHGSSINLFHSGAFYKMKDGKMYEKRSLMPNSALSASSRKANDFGAIDAFEAVKVLRNDLESGKLNADNISDIVEIIKNSSDDINAKYLEWNKEMADQDYKKLVPNSQLVLDGTMSENKWRSLLPKFSQEWNQRNDATNHSNLDNLQIALTELMNDSEDGRKIIALVQFMRQREVGNNFLSIDALSIFDKLNKSNQLQDLTVSQAEDIIRSITESLADEKVNKLFTSPLQKEEFKLPWNKRSEKTNKTLLEAISIALPVVSNRRNEEYKSLYTAVDLLTREISGQSVKASRVGHSCSNILNKGLFTILKVKNAIK